MPAFGPIAAAETVCRLFATPVFLDIEPHTYGLDPMLLQQACTDKTRAIVASHLYGYSCVIDQIHQFAEANGLVVIEDATQSLGARHMNRKVGTYGMAGCFSFHPTLNLGAAGDGGMLVTDDDIVAERVRSLRDLGRGADENSFEELGFASVLDSFQGLVLRMKLEELDESNADRIENARLYDRLLDIPSIKRPRFSDDYTHVYCHYTIELDQRDELRAFLSGKGIETKVFYPTPLHLQPCFDYLEYAEGAFPVAENVAQRVLSLPIYPGLKKKEIEEVAAAVREFMKKGA
ncbi:MAG: dTDP-3-amino-3,6-dideoxy-alpha-D-galactopyranose transaminase [candidate division BRC1 bacterium ADurb.BinA364]|nr:MAG: dTDP-3-amino-3,6-dideoxy-alpha-D-galactopyranose transaminase [candidate division BRC1 bacterium ADurb.BinA364]